MKRPVLLHTNRPMPLLRPISFTQYVCSFQNFSSNLHAVRSVMNLLFTWIYCLSSVTGVQPHGNTTIPRQFVL